MNIDIEKERAEFEAWAQNSFELHRNSAGEYSSNFAQTAWWAWQARAALQSQDRDEVELSKIGRAIYRACSDLPDGYEIRIDLEKGSGIVYVTDRDGDETMIESGDKLFSYQINEAIDHARRAEGESNG